MVVSGQVYAYGRFTTRDRSPGTHNIGEWMGSRTIVDILKKNKEIFLCRKSNPEPHTTPSGLPLVLMLCLKRQLLYI